MTPPRGRMEEEGCKIKTPLETRERAEAAATEIFERLVVVATDSVGFPMENTWQSAVEEGARLTRAFLKIDNPQVRAQIVELIQSIADITDRR